MGWWGRSVDKSTFGQAWQLEFDLRTLHESSGGWLLSVALWPPYMHQGLNVPTHTYTNRYICVYAPTCVSHTETWINKLIKTTASCGDFNPSKTQVDHRWAEGQPDLQRACQTSQGYVVKSYLKNQNNRGCRVVKGAYRSCQGPGFSLSNYRAAHNHWEQFQGIWWPLLASRAPTCEWCT